MQHTRANDVYHASFLVSLSITPPFLSWCLESSRRTSFWAYARALWKFYWIRRISDNHVQYKVYLYLTSSSELSILHVYIAYIITFRLYPFIDKANVRVPLWQYLGFLYYIIYIIPVIVLCYLHASEGEWPAQNTIIFIPWRSEGVILCTCHREGPTFECDHRLMIRVRGHWFKIVLLLVVTGTLWLMYFVLWQIYAISWAPVLREFPISFPLSSRMIESDSDNKMHQKLGDCINLFICEIRHLSFKSR